MRSFYFKFSIPLLILVLTILSVSGRDDKSLLKYFALVRIPTSVCETEGTGQPNGVCYSKKQCKNVGGTPAGDCASGYGTCCLVKMKDCSSGEPVKVKINGTHLMNPADLQNICQYLFPRPPGVCQLRLDFDTFVISQPHNLTHDCDWDAATISGASNTQYIGPFCGNLTGQHMYLDYGISSDITLTIFLESLMDQMWDIRVTYIKCDSPDKAPQGCLQYYTTPTGIVQSFNFYNLLQLNNEDYSVCVKPQSGMTKITWKACNGDPLDFVMTGQLPIIPPPGVPLPPIYSPASGDQCMTDWVMVFGANKYCGNQFPEFVTSTTQPFMINIHFDNEELDPPPECTECVPDDRNTGCCLMYYLSP